MKAMKKSYTMVIKYVREAKEYVAFDLDDDEIESYTNLLDFRSEEIYEFIEAKSIVVADFLNSKKAETVGGWNNLGCMCCLLEDEGLEEEVIKLFGT